MFSQSKGYPKDELYLEPTNICFYPELEPFKSVDCELVKTYLAICRGYVDQCRVRTKVAQLEAQFQISV